MNISASESTDLKHLCQLLINSPLKMEQQQHVIKDGKIWCSEFETLELCKYIIYGKTYYYNDPPPNRLKNSSLWSKEEVERKAEILLNKFNTVAELINFLKQERATFK
jgi:hypothetical protein